MRGGGGRAGGKAEENLILILSIHQGMQLSKSKWQDEFKGKAVNLPVNPNIISTNDTASYW